MNTFLTFVTAMSTGNKNYFLLNLVLSSISLAGLVIIINYYFWSIFNNNKYVSIVDRIEEKDLARELEQENGLNSQETLEVGMEN